MPAYVVSVARVLDAEAWARYRAIAGLASALYGARYLARGQKPDLAQASPASPVGAEHTVTIIEFPSMELLRQWYDSAEYAPARVIAQTACERDLLFVEGAVPVVAAA